MLIKAQSNLHRTHNRHTSVDPFTWTSKSRTTS